MSPSDPADGHVGSRLAFAPAESLSDSRERVIRALIRLIAKRGADARVTTKEIAEEAGVGESTLFREFDTKGHIINLAYDYCWAQVNKILSQASFVPEEIVADPRENIINDFHQIALLFDSGDEAHDIVNLAFMFHRRREEYRLHSAQQELFESRLLRYCEFVMERTDLTTKYATPEVLAADLLIFLITAWRSWWMWRDQHVRVPSEEEFLNGVRRKLSSDRGGGSSSSGVGDPRGSREKAAR